jgi:hypothetical protein
MNLIDEVLQRPELVDRPPVLVDVGASGQIHGEWDRIARYAICIAFDADDRDFSENAQRAHPYRTLHLHNHIVTDTDAPELEFFLTRSPHCSSALAPDTEALRTWIFADLFDVERNVRLRARSFPEILKEHGLAYVDWFKTDSQGTDLRLFLSLGDAVARRVLAASFEPGIIDAYRGEDKLHAVLSQMDRLPFWMHAMHVRGTQRLSRELWETRVKPLTGNRLPLGLPTCPCWAEISYLNELEPKETFDLRDHLLAWVFATLERQHGYALDQARRGRDRFGDPLFSKLERSSMRRVASLADRYLPLPAKKAVGVLQRAAARLLRS